MDESKHTVAESDENARAAAVDALTATVDIQFGQLIAWFVGAEMSTQEAVGFSRTTATETRQLGARGRKTWQRLSPRKLERRRRTDVD
jgi:hypothetical protein